jgi:hypothetical protein
VLAAFEDGGLGLVEGFHSLALLKEHQGSRVHLGDRYIPTFEYCIQLRLILNEELRPNDNDRTLCGGFTSVVEKE